MKFFLFALTLLSTPAWASEAPLAIIKTGNPILAARAIDVPVNDILTSDIQNLIDDMINTLGHNLGLAAPQVNVSKRLFVMAPADGPFSPKGPVEVVINPTMEYDPSSLSDPFPEFCLSIPGKNFEVKRYQHMKVMYYDRYARLIERDLSGFPARTFQHEYDHINGILISDVGTEGKFPF